MGSEINGAGVPPVESAKILPFKKKPALLEEPRPERIQSLIWLDGECRVVAILSIGVVIRTHDHANMPIAPVKEIMLAIGDEDNPERTTFSLPASLFEGVLDRCPEFIKACRE